MAKIYVKESLICLQLQNIQNFEKLNSNLYLYLKIMNFSTKKGKYIYIYIYIYITEKKYK